MKLLRAEFQNFRLLRDLKLDFATDPEKKLTVIRAANETGKTTILNALQWALYGDAALPGKGEDYRLHPIDWETSEGKRVPISVTVEFEIVKYRQGTGGMRENRRRYRIVRSAFEDIEGATLRRQPAGMTLYALNETGADRIDSPESFINDELPPELREVFFTDGDRALSFIEADVALSTKRDRVQKAIRSLLGLGVIEEAIRHVNKSAAEINKQAKKAGTGGQLGGIATDLEGTNNDIAKFEGERDKAREQFAEFDEKLNEIERKITATLQKGDREKLSRDIETAKKEISRIDERITAANKQHSALFRSDTLTRDLLAPVLGTAVAKLDELRDQNKIPNTTIPVLEHRLSVGTCICGEGLDDDGSDGSKRRSHIHKLIDDSRGADAVQAIVADLYFSSRALQSTPTEPEGTWRAEYKGVMENRDGLSTLRTEAGKKLRGYELQLDEVPDADIQGLRETRNKYKEQRERFLIAQTKLDAQIDNLVSQRNFLTEQRDRLLREQKKGARILSELEVTNDIVQVLKASFDQITNEELDKVSTLMNSIFLEMIGADPSQGAIIRRAEISPEFDIIVYGPNDRTLNPDRDLNGASRRALTLAFILALTKVSDVEAPNVIDTPLGMMSGYVKHSVLKTAIRESSQLVLFLTHSEIAGCEELIAEAAGSICTLTNPAHYPKMLVNNPGVAERKVLRCDCDHTRECHLCQRKHDSDISFAAAE